MIGVGFSSNKASLERLPGWEQESWAYHGDDGKIFFGDSQGQGRPYGPTFTVNDTIGCGVNFSTGCAFFTKNGHSLGKDKNHPPQAITHTNSMRFVFRYRIPGVAECETVPVCWNEETTRSSL